MRFTALTLLAMLAWLFGAAAVAEQDSYTILIKDHRFQPETLTVPTDKRIQLVIDNQDATPEEFESHALGLEKVISGGSKGTVRFGPLPAGEYTFFGEFHKDTAQGRIVAQ